MSGVRSVLRTVMCFLCVNSWRRGAVPMSVIDDRVRDILRVKFIVGLFDDPYQRDYKAADEEVDSPENNLVALQASRESIVLLKNAGRTLPLDPEKLDKVAVIGPNADETSYALTHYGPLATEVTSVLAGLEGASGGQGGCRVRQRLRPCGLHVAPFRDNAGRDASGGQGHD